MVNMGGGRAQRLIGHLEVEGAGGARLVHADGYAVQLMEPPAARRPLRLDDAATYNKQMTTQHAVGHITTDHTRTSHCGQARLGAKVLSQRQAVRVDSSAEQPPRGPRRKKGHYSIVGQAMLTASTAWRAGGR